MAIESQSVRRMQGNQSLHYDAGETGPGKMLPRTEDFAAHVWMGVVFMLHDNGLLPILHI